MFTSPVPVFFDAVHIPFTFDHFDQDTCATNFMIRDEKMKALVAPDKEPITAFVRKVRPLFQELDVSTLLVVGGSGDFFTVADAVIMMDE